MSNWAQKGYFSPELREERRKANAKAKKSIAEQSDRLANPDGIKACVREVGNAWNPFYKVIYWIDDVDYVVKDSSGHTKLFKTFAGAKKWCERKYFFIFD